MKTKSLFILIFSIIYHSTCMAQENRIWSTYVGGNKWDDSWNITTDTYGNVYMAGLTNSDSNIAFNGFQNTYGGGSDDAFLVKFDSTGNRIWATYYGGDQFDAATSIATDSNGYIYMAGYTTSTDNIASGGFQNSYGGGNSDVFLVKFDSTGNRIWATYYGGAGNEFSNGGNRVCSVTTDCFGNIFLTGNTTSLSNIAAGGYQNNHSSFSSDIEAFLIKFDSNGNRIWGTYYGWLGVTEGRGVVADTNGNVYMAGLTSNSSGIAFNGFQNTFGGVRDVFIVKFDSTGNRLWATYYGGENFDITNSVTLDHLGNLYLTGYTGSTSGIAASGFQNTYGGGSQDAFLVKFNANGIRQWATYFGGNDSEEANSVVVDSLGSVYIAGDTYSSTGIEFGGFLDSLVGIESLFLIKFDSFGNRFCSTYYGQSHEENGSAAVSSDGYIYLSGSTQSTFGIASGGFQNIYGGGIYDAYLVKFSSCDRFLGLSIPENHSLTNYNIYPNPTTKGITIDLGEVAKEVTITLTNSLGQVLLNQQFEDTDIINIDLNVPSGIYFLQLKSSDGKTKSIKILKQ